MAFASYEQLKTGSKKKSSSKSASSDYDSLKKQIGSDAINIRKRLLEESDRKKRFSESQGVGELEKTLREQEAQVKGFTKLDIFQSPLQTAQDLFLRKQKDQDYLRQIEQNNKTVQQIVERKKTNPEKAGDYDIMLEALMQKNQLLSEASGGALKDKTNLQLVGQSVGTAADLMPFGAGLTTAGRMILGQGGKKIAGSLLKEGATQGFISGGATVAQKKKEDIVPREAIGEVISSTIIGSLVNLGVGLAANKLGEKVSKWLNGEKVEFTPKEKDSLRDNVPEMSNEAIFQEAGIEPPVKTTDTEVLSKTIAASDSEETISKLLKGKVPDTELPTLSKALKTVTNEDDVARILDEYNPKRIQEELSLKIATTDNEKKISTLLKGTVPDDQISQLSRIFKNMEDEVEIDKILQEFRAKDVPVVTPKEADVPKVATLKEISSKEFSDAIGTDPTKKEAFDTVIKPKLDALPEPKEGEVIVYRSGKIKDESYVNTDPKEVFNYPVDEDMTVQIVKESELASTGSKDKDSVGYRVFKKEKKEPSTPPKKDAPKKEEPKKKAESKKEEPRPTKTKSGLSATTLRDASKSSMMKELKDLDVPELDTLNMAEQADKAVKLILDDEDLAIRIAMGDENPPAGLKVGSVYSAVKEMAIKNGDIDLIMRLATSENINALAREFGQEVKAFDSGIARDPVKVIKQILDIRKESAGDTAMADVKAAIKDMKDKVVKTDTTDTDVASFITGIKC